MSNDTIKEQAATIKNLHEQVARADNIVHQCLADNYNTAMAYTVLELRFISYKRETDMRINDYERRIAQLEKEAVDNKTVAEKVKRFEPLFYSHTDPE